MNGFVDPGFYQGTEWRVQLTLTDEGGQAVSLEGLDLRCDLYGSAGAASPDFTFLSTNNSGTAGAGYMDLTEAHLGKVTLIAKKAQHQNVSVGRTVLWHLWDITDPDNPTFSGRGRAVLGKNGGQGSQWTVGGVTGTVANIVVAARGQQGAQGVSTVSKATLAQLEAVGATYPAGTAARVENDTGTPANNGRYTKATALGSGGAGSWTKLTDLLENEVQESGLSNVPNTRRVKDLFDDGLMSCRLFGISPSNTASQNATGVSDLLTFLLTTQSGAGFPGKRIPIPAGTYAIGDVVLENAGNELRNIRFVGDGGSVGEGATRLVFQPTAPVVAAFDLLSLQSCSFEDMEIIAGNSNMDYCLRLRAQEDAAIFSSFSNLFLRVGFRALSAVNVGEALCHVYDTGLTKFHLCWWTGDDDAVVIGENSAAVPLSAAQGTANVHFDTCHSSNDFRIRRSLNSSWINCKFGRSATDLHPAAIVPEGDEYQEATEIINPANVESIGDVNRTFWRQGAAGVGARISGGKLRPYVVKFDIDGLGGVEIDGVKFSEARKQVGNELISGQTGIIIRNGVPRVKIGATNEFEELQDLDIVPVLDEREAPVAPVLVDESLASDHTFTTVGASAYETIIEVEDVRFTGRRVLVQYTVSILGAATANYIARLVIGGVIIQGASTQSENGASGVITTLRGRHEFVHAATDHVGLDVELRVRQSGGSFSTIQATDQTYTTHLLVKELEY